MTRKWWWTLVPVIVIATQVHDFEPPTIQRRELSTKTDEIHVGMTRPEVIKALGSLDRCEGTMTTRQAYYWDSARASFRVIFDRAGVADVRRLAPAPQEPAEDASN